MSKSTVPLVEDEILIRAILADKLIDRRYEVVEAGNVLQAIAILSRRPAF